MNFHLVILILAKSKLVIFMNKMFSSLKKRKFLIVKQKTKNKTNINNPIKINISKTENFQNKKII